MTNSPINIVAYHGFGTSEAIVLMGRVLKNVIKEGDEMQTGAWQNFWASLQRFESDELPNINLRARFREETWETVTDDEGYFSFELHPSQPLDPTETWHSVELEWWDPERDLSSPPVTGRILTPPLNASIGVISDVDDTIVKSYMTQLSKAAGELLFKNVEERETYPDLPAFYRALAAGTGAAGNNPIFYISLSPWNLFGFLDEFLEIKGLPRGPLLLRDFSWETIREALQRQPGTSPKLPLIRQVLVMYPALPFVLCGDSGQHDPETYREVVLEHPSRIRAIYLRDVTGPERRSEIEAIGAQMHALGIPFVLSSDTVDFAADAMRQGLIRTDWLEAEAMPQAVRENAASESITGT